MFETVEVNILCKCMLNWSVLQNKNGGALHDSCSVMFSLYPVVDPDLHVGEGWPRAVLLIKC